MVEPNIDAGIKALRDGDLKGARRILGEIVRLNPDHSVAWWYLSFATQDNQQRAHCLRQVIRLSHDHREASIQLAEIERRIARPTPAGGLPHPVITNQDLGSGVAIPESVDGTESAKTAGGRIPRLALALTAVTVLAALGGVILTLTSQARMLTGDGAALPAPKSELLRMNIANCVASTSDSAQLEFVNETLESVTVLQGVSGQESPVVSLGAGRSAQLIVQPAIRIRYLAITDDQTRFGGAIIEASARSRCVVLIQTISERP